MYKYLLVLLVICCPFLSFSKYTSIQLSVTPRGIPAIVVTTDEIKASTLYNRTLDWIKENYPNANNSIQLKKENEKIVLKGFKPDACWFINTGETVKYNMDYTISIEFKNGRYKFELVINQFSRFDNKPTVPYSSFYNKENQISSGYKNALPSLSKTINEILDSYNSFVTNNYIKPIHFW